MSERAGTWKARETIRLHLGLAVACLVFAGGLVLALEVLSWVGVGNLERSLPRPVVLLFGLGLLACAIGLWKAKEWARWAASGLFALVFLASVDDLVRERTLSLALPLAPLATIYLALPSTGKRFARARGAR